MAGHGSNRAAWAGVLIALAGFTLGGIALVLGPHWVLFWIGVALLPLSVVIGKVMSVAGLGDPASR